MPTEQQARDDLNLAILLKFLPRHRPGESLEEGYIAEETEKEGTKVPKNAVRRILFNHPEKDQDFLNYPNEPGAVRWIGPIETGGKPV